MRIRELVFKIHTNESLKDISTKHHIKMTTKNSRFHLTFNKNMLINFSVKH